MQRNEFVSGCAVLRFFFELLAFSRHFYIYVDDVE